MSSSYPRLSYPGGVPTVVCDVRQDAVVDPGTPPAKIEAPYLWARRPVIMDIAQFGAIGDNVEHKLSEIFSSLSQAQRWYPCATSLNDLIDWAAWQTAVDTMRNKGAFKAYLTTGDPANYRWNRGLIGNPTLDCNSLYVGLSIIGPGGHRAYDSGTDMPVTITLAARDGVTLPSMLDLRACQKFHIKGLGLYAYTAGSGVIEKVIRFGAEDCANQASIVRVGTIEGCLLYGGTRSIDGYLTSGFKSFKNNVSRAKSRGFSLNACGDLSIESTMVNNIGPMLTATLQTDTNSGLGADYYDGAGFVAYGGGGNNRIHNDCRFEVMNKGILLDNVQGYQIYGNFIDKCREFGLGVSTNANISGTTNIAYLPRSISIFGNRFVSNGWNSTYNTHIFLRNGGTNAKMEVTMGMNTYGWGGPNAIDLLPDVYSTQLDIFGVGPYRSIRAVNLSQGTSRLDICTTDNYSGGSTDMTIDSPAGQDQNIYLHKSGAVMYDKPIAANINVVTT